MKNILLILSIIFGANCAFGMDTPDETAVETPKIVITLALPIAPRSVGSNIIAPIITIIAIKPSVTPSTKNKSKAPKSNSKNLLSVDYRPNGKNAPQDELF